MSAPSGTRLLVLSLFLLLCACGGGGSGGGSAGGSSDFSFSSSSSSSASSTSSSSSSSSSSSTGAFAANAVDVVVDAGPPGLSNGGAGNVPYVTVTVCAQGTATCQTIDHVLVDTGSVGLRIMHDALNATMQAALAVKPAAAGKLGECYQYIDGYVFGSVATVDAKIGGETASNLGMMIIGDKGNFAAVPTACSSTGGTALDTVDAFGANGVIGIGLGNYDCGSYCNTTSNSFYYDCTATGCTQIAWGSANQVWNPIIQFPVDNNGSLLDFPAPSPLGQATLHGTLYFGIATQSNNAIDAGAAILPIDSTGHITATYNSQVLSKSFIDSGSNFLAFSDGAITQCTGGLKGFYCPPTPLTISVMLSGNGSGSASVSLAINNAKNFNGSYAVLPGLAGDPSAFDSLTPSSNSFDLGLPFFYGRRVYTSIVGRKAGAINGGFLAF
ncbi:MAG: DUF3443 family protein [Asticcacaulis sp.]